MATIYACRLSNFTSDFGTIQEAHTHHIVFYSRQINSWYLHIIYEFKYPIVHGLKQESANPGQRTKFGPRTIFSWPAKHTKKKKSRSLSVCWRVCRCVGESVGVLASLSVCWRVCRCVGESVGVLASLLQRTICRLRVYR